MKVYKFTITYVDKDNVIQVAIKHYADQARGLDWATLYRQNIVKSNLTINEVHVEV